MLFGPEELSEMTDATLYEMGLREISFIIDVWPFQKEEERVIKWPGCNHFYAKIGEVDVHDKNGNYKWNTEKAAKEAIKWFLNKD